MASNLRDKAEHIANNWSPMLPAEGDRQCLANDIHAALVECVEECAKVADDEQAAWVGDGEDAYGGRIASGEIAAAIRALRQQGVEHG